MTDVDLVVKCFTVLGGVIGVAKICYEMFVGHRIRMRDEYKFAKDFLADLDEGKTIHPFLKEKGYQAVAGSSVVTAKQIEYLLTLQDPTKAMKDFVLGIEYLTFRDGAVGQEILFSRKRFGLAWYRGLWKAFYVILYVVCFLVAVLPWLFFSAHFTTSVMIQCFAVFGCYAIYSLLELTRIVRAERLVQRYQKHKTPIIVTTVV